MIAMIGHALAREADIQRLPREMRAKARQAKAPVLTPAPDTSSGLLWLLALLCLI